MLYDSSWSDDELRNPPADQTMDVDEQDGRAVVRLELPPSGMVILGWEDSMRRPIFVRPLSVEERAMIEDLWQTSNPLERTRIRIVLESSAGMTAAGIAQQVGWTPRAIRRVIQRFNLTGLLGLSDRRRTNPGRRRIVTDEWQEQLLTMTEQKPTVYGYPATRWTSRLLATCLSQINQIYVSEERVRHYLHRNGYRYANRQWSKTIAPLLPVLAELESDSTGDDSLSISVEKNSRQSTDEDVSI